VFPFGDVVTVFPPDYGIAPNFKPPVPGAPLIRAVLDETGLHFNPSRIARGVYNIAFSDTLSDRVPGTHQVVLHIRHVPLGHSWTVLSVRAGETGGGFLCGGFDDAVVTVDGVRLATGDLTIESCETPVT
jgi:hypothetical protein